MTKTSWLALVGAWAAEVATSCGALPLAIMSLEKSSGLALSYLPSAAGGMDAGDDEA
jgi:hypothetical protein